MLFVVKLAWLVRVQLHCFLKEHQEKQLNQVKWINCAEIKIGGVTFTENRTLAG